MRSAGPSQYCTMRCGIAPLVASVAVLLGAPAGVRACDTALLLAVDVSNSVDAAEYRLQIDGLADALRDPEIVRALIEGQGRLAVIQWSGAERQALSLDWAAMPTRAEVRQFFGAARALDRSFVLSDTAPAEAIRFDIRQFDRVPERASHHRRLG